MVQVGPFGRGVTTDHSVVDITFGSQQLDYDNLLRMPLKTLKNSFHSTLEYMIEINS